MSPFGADQTPAAQEEQVKSDRLEDVIKRVVIEVDRVDANPKLLKKGGDQVQGETPSGQ